MYLVLKASLWCNSPSIISCSSLLTVQCPFKSIVVFLLSLLWILMATSRNNFKKYGVVASGDFSISYIIYIHGKGYLLKTNGRLL